MIQKVWRGILARRHAVPRIVHKARLTRRLRAMVIGWRVRRVITRSREVLRVRKDLLQIEQRRQQPSNSQ
jgi:hypothetical protein